MNAIQKRCSVCFTACLRNSRYPASLYAFNHVHMSSSHGFDMECAGPHLNSALGKDDTGHLEEKLSGVKRSLQRGFSSVGGDVLKEC